jgi:LysM repeat protein
LARKYQNSTYKTISGATFGAATVGGNTVSTLTYTLVDGGPLDADGTANGTIVDPVGAAVIASTSNSSSSNSGSSGSTSSKACNSSKPSGTADLFQIDATGNQARLYFTPLVSNVTNYYVSYGYSSGDERFGTMTGLGPSTGVLSYMINDLSPNVTYYFKVRPQNDCMPGDWSNEMKVTTAKTSGGLIYYKNFLTQVFAVFPKQISEINSTNVLGATTENTQIGKTCTEYTVKPGDSLWNIASKYLGDGASYSSIVTSNQLVSHIVNPGQKIKVGC